MRMTITVPDQIANRITEYSELTGVPKSTMIQMAVTQYLDSQKMIESLPNLLQEFKKMVEIEKKKGEK